MRIGWFKHHDPPAVGQTPVAVAAPRRLNDTFQRRQCAVHRVKIQIDAPARRGARRDDHAAAAPGLEPRLDFRHHLQPMGGAKVGGQQKQTVFSTKFLQTVEKFPRMAAQVDQHADAVLPGNLGGKLLPRRVLATFSVDEQPPLHPHTAHLVVQCRTVRQNFGRGPVRARQRTEVRLGGGGKYHAAAIFAAQRIDGLHRGGGKVGG